MTNFPQGTLPRLIQVALAEVGTAETGNNETKYGKFMKADKLPWCGSFLNWCAHQAGVKVPNVVSTKAGAEAFKKAKQWHTTPKIGDFVFFDFIVDDKTTINHIGLVIRASEKQIVTIEGNTSSGGDQRLLERGTHPLSAVLGPGRGPLRVCLQAHQKTGGAAC